MLPFRWAQCRRIQPALWDFASERLSEEMMEQVEQHLHGCIACDRELASLKRAQTLLAACRAQEEPAPRADWSDLRQRIVADGLAHIATPASSRRTGKTAGRERATNGYCASWTMQLATSAAGGFAAVLVLGLGYGAFHARNTGAVSRTMPTGTVAANTGLPASSVVSAAPGQVVPTPPEQLASASDAQNAQWTKNIFIALNSLSVQSDKIGTAGSMPARSVHVDATASAPTRHGSHSITAFRVTNTARERKATPRMDYAAASMPPRMTYVGLREASARRAPTSKTFADATITPKSRRSNGKFGQQSASAPQTQIASNYALGHVKPDGSDSGDFNINVIGVVSPVSREDDGVY